MKYSSRAFLDYGLSLILLATTLSIFTGCGKDSSTEPTPNNNHNNTTVTFTIDTIAQNGEYPAIAVDNNGIPHISYLNYDDGYVKYATINASLWTISSIGYAANFNGTLANGGVSSIAVDASNNPHITYFDYGNGQFRYAKYNGVSWTLSTIILPEYSQGYNYLPWAECAIAIDSATNTAHVSLQMLGYGYALGYWNTGLNNAIAIDNADNNTGYHNAIALDRNGYPHISYEARGSGKLKYASWNGSLFNVETVDTTVAIYWENRLSSIDIDPSGNPHIFYISGYDGCKFKYAYKTGGSWSIQTFIYSYDYPSISLSIDGSGSAHVAFVGARGILQYGYLNGSSWTFTEIDNNVNRCAIKVDKAGKVHIVYEQGSPSTLIKYATK
jgi:hypothetical protein